MRIRLLTLLHETKNRLDDFIKRAKKNDFDHAGFGPDTETLKQIIVYLHDLGLTAEAGRLKAEMAGNSARHYRKVAEGVLRQGGSRRFTTGGAKSDAVSCRNRRGRFVS